MNRATGNPAPAWVETRVEYANTVNAAIHRAGKLLLRLLQQDHHHHPRQDVLLSMVHEEVQRMEAQGIESTQRQVGTYRRLSMAALPRQRQYYRRAFHAAQSILSATLLGQPGGGPEELLVDYALSMNSLFQEYSQRVLTRTVDSLREDIDHLDQLAGVRCESEPLLRPFAGSETHHRPDHLLTDGGETLAVLDSKYYRAGKNPADDGDSRSRLFAYAYLTDTNRLAFLCPQFHSLRLPVRHTDAELAVVSPDGVFTCGSYERLVREYVVETLALSYPELRVFDAVADGHLCLSSVSEGDLEAVHDTSGPFSITNPVAFADSIITAIGFAPYAPNKAALEANGRWTKDRIKEACEKTDADGRPRYPPYETTCVPVYEPDADTGTLTLYFLRETEAGLSVSTDGPRVLR